MWECELLSSPGDILPLEGLEDIAYPEIVSEFKSGLTEITIPGGRVDEFSVFVPPKATIEVDNSKALRRLGGEKDQRSRRLAQGTRRVLAVRVIDGSGVSTTSTSRELTEKIFGSNGKNLATQYDACSYGKLKFVPTRALNGSPPLRFPGVYEVNLSVSVKDFSEAQARAHVIRQLREDFGDTNRLPAKFDNAHTDDSLPFDHVMLCLPPGTKGGWIASGFENSWLSTFNDKWCNFLSAQMHELGHNINLEHAGDSSAPITSSAREYGDQSGFMGSLYGLENAPEMCFNGAKSFQMGWYDDKVVTVAPFSSSWSGRVGGICDYQNPKTETVVLKIETGTDEDYFVNFNRRNGINSGTREGGNQVLVTKQGTNGVGYSVSYLQAKLTSGRSFTIPNFGESGRPVYIKVDQINLNSSPAYADVSVEMGCTSDSDCQRDAMFACPSYCSTRTNTCEVKTGCDCDATCNASTEDMFQCPSDCLDSKVMETTKSGGNMNDGSMFDIVAKNEVQITSFDIDTLDHGEYINAYVYTKVGGYSGHELKPERWKHIQTARIASLGENELTRLPKLPNPIVIPAGGRQAFYITLGSPQMQHTDGQEEGRLFASDNSIEIFEGAGIDYPFREKKSAQVWSGRVNYVEVPSVQVATIQGVAPPPPKLPAPTSTSGANDAEKKKRAAKNKRKRLRKRRQRRRRFRWAS